MSGCVTMTVFWYHRHTYNSKNFRSVVVGQKNTFSFASALSENKKELTQVLSSS